MGLELINTDHIEGGYWERASPWQGWDQHHKLSNKAPLPNTNFSSAVTSNSTFLGCQGMHKLQSIHRGTLAQ